MGRSLLVCPVTKPMYYERESRVLSGAGRAQSGSGRSRRVYLPAGQRWYDFWSGVAFEGGQSVEADAPLDRIPLFVRAGSIVPMTTAMQYVDEARDAPWELRVYAGRDAEFTLYEDSGDGYAYERGEWARVRVCWSEERRELTIGAREGKFPELVQERECVVRFVLEQGEEERRLRYAGAEERIVLAVDGVRR
jgi:alpha-D-xyloside xylohydrolase